MSPVLNKLWRYGPLILWIVFIWFASTNQFSAANTSQVLRPILVWLFPNISEARLAALHFLTRKAAHFTEYAILAFLARRALVTSHYDFARRNWFFLSLAFLVFYALLDEFHQTFVPSRTGSVYDSAIDVAGGLTVLLLCRLMAKKSKRTVVLENEGATL